VVKTPTQMKNLITDWCDEIKEPYNSMTPKEKGNQPIEWGLLIGPANNKIVAYVPIMGLSRVVFNMQLNFADVHKKITSEMKKEIYNDFILKITDKLTTYDVNWNFKIDGQQISNLVMIKYLDESELTRSSFFHMLDRCKVIKMQMLRMISFTLGGTPQSTADSGSNTTPGVV